MISISAMHFLLKSGEVFRISRDSYSRLVSQQQTKPVGMHF